MTVTSNRKQPLVSIHFPHVANSAKVSDEHSWAPMVKKTSIRSMVVIRKKNPKSTVDTIGQNQIFSPMINTIGQSSKIFNRWIDTFSVKHDR
jgi:hypothetical protein